ncbi:hypothetical protein HWV62_27638 [Athelia sp. TMB]|nr:hypothetical protein HWV62_27638 [Athelia sp. TMB]
MSFFGLQQNDLENDKQNFIDGGLQASEDLAVYTWGEDSYDGLGDALQEGGDELNDETFGGSSNVGKDFDFASQALPDDVPKSAMNYAAAARDPQPNYPSQAHDQGHAQPNGRLAQSLESLWDDKSPFSALPRTNKVARPVEPTRTPSAARNSPYISNAQGAPQQHILHSGGQTGVRTLQDIEAEMLALASRNRQGLDSPQMHQQQAFAQREMQQQREQQLQQQQEHLQWLQEQKILQQQHALQQQQQLHQRTPPPRMMPQSQSPRFHLHQQQVLLLQQQQAELQQQQRLQELQDQLRLEEIERQLRTQQLSDLGQGPNYHLNQRPPSGPSLLELQAIQAQQLRRQRSPAGFANGQIMPIPGMQNMQHMPHNEQMQRRLLLSEMAQAEFLQNLQGVSPEDQEILRAEAMRKIVEAERMEDKRRRRAAKIAHMARYNDLMTQGDKDFITRIQVSQLVTQDPYADDFYAQVYGAILRSRLGLQQQDERVLKFGSGGGVGLGLPQKGATRRPNAMQRMEAQVERIVSNAKMREKEKGLHSLHSLQGALGRTSGRSYKAAPRQLLQVDPNSVGASPTLSHAAPHISKEDATNHEGAAKEAAKLGREVLGDAAPVAGTIRKEPLTHRQVLVLLENLYDLVLEVEQHRRDQPPQEDEEACQAWETKYAHYVQRLLDGFRLTVPIETSDPHPFISMLGPAKGKRVLPRVARHFGAPQMLQMGTFLVATFSQLDVVRLAPDLDTLDDTPARAEAETQTQVFLGSVLQSILPLVAKASLRLVTGLLSLLIDRGDLLAIAKSKPGLALLTLFLSRVEVIKQSINNNEPVEMPTNAEAGEWNTILNHLYQLLTPHLSQLFPSTRLASVLPPLGHGNRPTDIMDQPVWQFLAALALHASPEQQQILVTSLREKVLENVESVTKGWVADVEEGQTKLANVNLFLHALGLDSSQIAM